MNIGTALAGRSTSLLSSLTQILQKKRRMAEELKIHIQVWEVWELRVNSACMQIYLFYFSSQHRSLIHRLFKSCMLPRIPLTPNIIPTAPAPVTPTAT
jgi:hypothetical protein